MISKTHYNEYNQFEISYRTTRSIGMVDEQIGVFWLK